MPPHIVPPSQRKFSKHLRRHQTSGEERLWHELRGRRLDGLKFRRQVPIDRYIVDFMCFECRLVVEVDGPLHRKTEQALKDDERDAVLRGLGFRVVRFSDEVATAAMLDGIRAVISAPHPAAD